VIQSTDLFAFVITGRVIESDADVVRYFSLK